MKQSIQREKLEDRVHRKSAVNLEKNKHSMNIKTVTSKINLFSSEKRALNKDSTHSNVINIETRTNKINPFSSENDTLRTEVGCFTKSDNVKKSTTEINSMTQCDSHMKNRRNNSCGNISSISNSDVEMTWRSQRVLLEQRNHQQVNVNLIDKRDGNLPGSTLEILPHTPAIY